MSKSLRFLVIGVSALLFAPEVRSQGAEVDIEDIVARADDAFAIHVVSGDDSMRNLALRAFQTHGRFEIVRSEGEADFTLAFEPAGEAAVALRISSGSPSRVLLEQNVSASSRRAAVLRAGDLVVQRTTGRPGYFSGRLTFIGQETGAREVYTSDFLLGNRMQLTRDNSKSVSPRWGPGGGSILYTGYYRSGFPDIFHIDLDSMSRTRLIHFRGTNTGARFSPNGRRISMVLSGEGSPEVYVGEFASRNLTNIRKLTDTGGSVQSSPTWSPDGRELIFVSDRDGRPQLYRMRSDGRNTRRIPTDISRYCAEPDWNPVDPNKVAFTAAVGRGFAIAVYDFSTRESRFVTQGPHDAIEPRWTNDGRHLLYTERSPERQVLAVLDTETGKTTRLADGRFGRLSQVDFLMP